MAATTNTRTLFDPELVTDLFNKVKGHSTLAKLSGQSPMPFVGTKQYTFSFDSDVDIIGENGAKSEGGITLTPITITPVKFEYGARVSDEFMYCTEEERIEILKAFNEGFAAKLAKGFDKAAFTGVNPRTGNASTVVGTNNFESKVTQRATYTAGAEDDGIDDAIALVHGADGEVTGIAMAPAYGSAMGKIKANGASLYPEFRFGGVPASLNGMAVDVNSTLAGASKAFVGDFANAFKWGYGKDIEIEVIQYGDPDNSGADLKGHNQVYIRGEAYIGWGILAPAYFAKIQVASQGNS